MATLLSPADSDTALARVLCTHCGLPTDAPASHDGPAFCCDACATAFEMIRSHGLGAYHRFAERRPSHVRSSGRTFADFDHEAFQSRFVEVDANGHAHVQLALEGVHCASCVWLVERVPLLLPGVERAELDIRQNRASVSWDPRATSLSGIAQTLDSLGYTPHPFRGREREAIRRHDDRAMLMRIGIAGAIATNVMLAALALYAGQFSPMDRASESFFRWISLALTVPALVWPGRLFFTVAWSALRTRRVNMDVPVALALAAGATRGAINTVAGSGPIYFDGVCALVFLLLVGRFLQARGTRIASDATEQLFALTPATTHVRLADGTVRDVPADALQCGDTVAVYAGETIPADGTVSSGTSTLNSAILTGESADHRVGVGDIVFAGTVNRSAELGIRVTAAGEDSRLARIMAQIDDSARRRAPIVQYADRLASRVVMAVLALAIITFLVWLPRDVSAAWDNAIALLIVTCPCALALATPLAMSTAVGRAAREGIFIRGSDALESLSRPGWLVLDKTGTLTLGESTCIAFVGDESVIPAVLALEQSSTHPIAAGFRRAWPDVRPAIVRDVTHVIGGGVTGLVSGVRYSVGSPDFISAQLDRQIPDEWMPAEADTPVLIAVGCHIAARAMFGDAVRPDAASALATLRSRGWRTMLLSGDTRGVSERVGASLGFASNEIIANATPEHKAEQIRSLVEAAANTDPSPCVVMVGDGVNDAVALASATVGVGVHGGAEASLATADVAIARPGLTSLVTLERIAVRTMRVIRINVAWAFTYNTIGVALAVSGHVSPLLAAIMMPVSSLTVVLASLLTPSTDKARL
jgi:P-type Cu2+ transporter